MTGDKSCNFSFRGSPELGALVDQFRSAHGLKKADALRTLVCEALANRDLNPNVPPPSGVNGVVPPSVGEGQHSLDPLLVEALGSMLERIEGRIQDSKVATYHLGRAVLSNLLKDTASRDAAREFLDQVFLDDGAGEVTGGQGSA